MDESEDLKKKKMQITLERQAKTNEQAILMQEKQLPIDSRGDKEKMQWQWIKCTIMTTYHNTHNTSPKVQPNEKNNTNHLS